MTLAYTYVGDIRGKVEVNIALITSTALDTTATVNSKTIDNNDGRLSFISFQQLVTDKTGTSPTLQLTLQGSDDGTNFTSLKDSAGNTIQTTALSLSGSGSGTTVNDYIDTVIKPRVAFPRYLRIQGVVGGSATPGWTGTVAVTMIRDKVSLN